MSKFKLAAIICFCFLLGSSIVAYAQAAAGTIVLVPAAPPVAALTAPPGMDWLVGLLGLISSIPKVGPVIAAIIKYVGALGAFFTAISAFFTAILKIPEFAARFAGLTTFADKLAKFEEQVTPYLRYLSILEAPKK